LQRGVFVLSKPRTLITRTLNVWVKEDKNQAQRASTGSSKTSPSRFAN